MQLDPDSIYEQIEARHILHPLSAVLQQAGINSAISDARCMLGIALGRHDAVLPHEIIARWQLPARDNLMRQNRIMAPQRNPQHTARITNGAVNACLLQDCR